MAPHFGWYPILGWSLSEISFDLFLMVIVLQFVTWYIIQREKKTASLGPSFPQKLVAAQVTASIGESSLENFHGIKKEFLGKDSMFDFYGFQVSGVVPGAILTELPRV